VIEFPTLRPVPNALVGIMGADLSVHSDSSGRFRLAHVPSGTRDVTVRTIGLAPTTFAITTRSGGTLDTTIAVGQSGQLLKEVTVLASRTVRVDRTGFTERMRVGLGNFLTQEEIEKRPAYDLYGYLQRVPGLIYRTGYGHAGRSEGTVRGIVMHGGGALGDGFCTPNFFLDGMYYPLDQGLESLQSLALFAQPAYLKGIEVYEHGATIPPQFDRSFINGCGSVVIWTK
jgi:hypothetical protein